MRWKLWLSLAFVGLLGLITLQNWQVVEVRLLWWQFDLSMVVLLAVIGGLGLLSGILLGLLYARHRQR